jgi:hypothetical protein
MSELVVALLAAGVGAGATYLLDVRKAAKERQQQLSDESRTRRQERVAVATALLSDLQLLESMLRQLFTTDKPLNAAGDRPPLFFDHLSGDVRRFAASSVHPIADFFRLAEQVFEVIHDLRARPDKINERLQHQTRCAAGFALQALVRAKDVLVAEGGEIPNTPPLDVVRFPDLPTIPKPVFPLSMQQAGENIPNELG